MIMTIIYSIAEKLFLIPCQVWFLHKRTEYRFKIKETEAPRGEYVCLECWTNNILWIFSLNLKCLNDNKTILRDSTWSRILWLPTSTPGSEWRAGMNYGRKPEQEEKQPVNQKEGAESITVFLGVSEGWRCIRAFRYFMHMLICWFPFSKDPPLQFTLQLSS